MKINSVVRVTLSAVMCIGLLGVTACASNDSQNEAGEVIGGQVITPITMEAAELDGTTVDLMVGQVLNVNTGDYAPEQFTGKSSDALVAEFQPGKDDGSAVFNPGVVGVSSGTAEVTMVSAAGDGTEIVFTVKVIAAEVN